MKLPCWFTPRLQQIYTIEEVEPHVFKLTRKKKGSANVQDTQHVCSSLHPFSQEAGVLDRERPTWKVKHE